jgi:hypothetical protein
VCWHIPVQQVVVDLLEQHLGGQLHLRGHPRSLVVRITMSASSNQGRLGRPVRVVGRRGVRPGGVSSVTSSSSRPGSR